jgi:sortase A
MPESRGPTPVARACRASPLPSPNAITLKSPTPSSTSAASKGHSTEEPLGGVLQHRPRSSPTATSSGRRPTGVGDQRNLDPVATTPPTGGTSAPPPSPQPTQRSATSASDASRLEIPILGIDAPVVEVPIEDATWDVSPLTQQIAHLGGTANPGQKGNVVLAGHVTLKRGAGPFLRLETLEAGDIAIVHASDRAYAYRVVSKKVVAPDDVSVVFPTSDPILTLLTCTGWDAATRSYTHRAAIICRLDEEQS